MQSQRSDEKLRLQWNDFQENISSAFKDLRDDKEFTDVTLACEDGQQVEAHKVVLISSSPFFKNLLQRNKHPHPLVYMRGMKSEDLVALIDFLYNGEANLFQENLDSFLAIANELQLKGLYENQTGAVYKENILRTSAKEPGAKTFSSLAEENAKVKPILINELNPETTVALNWNTGHTDIAELDEKVKSMILVGENSNPGKQRGKTRICKMCGKEGQGNAIVDHIEANHIVGISLPCNICGKISRARNYLAQHMRRCHAQ